MPRDNIELDPPEMGDDPVDEDAQRRDFWFRSLNVASRELRPELRIDEAGYLFVSPGAHAHPRDFFLYGVLDELQKAAVAILHWTELFEGEELSVDTEDDRQTNRILYGSVADEEALWTRKLTESLTDLICFQATDEPAYYRHYLLLYGLRERKQTAADLKNFYACPSKNVQASISHTAERIAEIESGGEIDLGRCWYTPRDEPSSADELERLPVRQLLTSTWSRLRLALAAATASEKIVLGMSYDRSFGRASRNMHFGPPTLNLPPDERAISGGLDGIGVLGLHVIRRTQLLTGLVPGKASRFINGLFEDNEVPEQAVARYTDAGVEVGDFVLGYGDPGEVIEIKESELGYRSYRVLYLAERPLPEIEDDWFPAQEVRLMMRRADLLDLWVRMSERMPGAIAQTAPELSADELAAGLRHGFKGVWEAELRDWVHTHWFRSAEKPTEG
jgi:hypothetical protein